MNLKDLAAYLIALAALAACVLFLHGVDSGLSGSDESSHFLNGYLIWAYLTEAAGANPLAYATDFYIHYPKISIGHWPPLYYVFLSALFFALPHAPAAFQCANLAVSALPAWLVARETRRAAGFPWAVTAAMACVTIPICIEDSTYLMLDQPLAAICFAAALIWSAYSRKPSLRLGLAFGSAAAIAILVKGNGWALALLPPFHAALAGRWRVLFDWRSFASAALVLVFVGAWTALTYRITSDGFQHAWGWAYFSQALPSFLGHTYANLGPVNALLALIGIGASLRSEDDGTRELGRSCLALILATLFFHSIVPVALDMRYISSALPPLAVFIALGLHALARRFASPLTAGAAWKWAIAGLIVVSAPGALFLRERPARYNMHMDAAAETLLHEYPKLVAVVDGSPGAEGAFASEVALRDSARQAYVVRGSQLLAESNFMGERYALRVETPEAVLGLLGDIACAAVVIADGPYFEPRFAHSALLARSLESPASPYRRLAAYKHDRHDGHTTLYVRKDLAGRPLPLDRIRRVNFPGKSPMSAEKGK